MVLEMVEMSTRLLSTAMGTEHCCHTIVTLVMHCCYFVVTLLLHCCYTVVTL
jgi:hypothetical protein